MTTYETAIRNLADQGLLSGAEVQKALRSQTRHVSALDHARSMGIQVGFQNRQAASDAQRSYIESLLAQRDLSGTSYDGWTPDWSKATKAAASMVIEYLKGLPVLVQPLTKTQTVPAGRYAVEREGVLRFYKVDCPTEGRWAGRTFVKVMASDEEHRVNVQEAALVLAAIAADPEVASTRYGREIGACGRCGRTLTDEASRARGIGPDCAQKGW